MAVAWENGQAVGFISPEFKVVVVSASSRRRGHGRRLVEAGLAIERERPPSPLSQTRSCREGSNSGPQSRLEATVLRRESGFSIPTGLRLVVWTPTSAGYAVGTPA